MAVAPGESNRSRRLRVTYVAMAAWFVVLAAVVGVVSGSVSASGLA
jgi:hypothetical protein